MKLAFLYAGQGSQTNGMGKSFYDSYETFRRVFDEAKLDFDLKEMCFSKDNELLHQTRYTQPAMVAFAVGVTNVLREQQIQPDYVAGLSLGEYSALYAAGVFEAQQAIELVAYRGAAMTEASKGIKSAMHAVLGLDQDALLDCIKKAQSVGVVSICNYNCPGQLVIGGEEAAVEKASALAKEAGAKRCMPLKVSGPFHTSLMEPAAKALAEKFKTQDFDTMQIPVLFNCIGREKDEKEEIPSLLVSQVKSPVYMENIIVELDKKGVDTIIEIGPGKALSGFVKKTVGKKMTCISVSEAEDLEGIQDRLKEANVHV